MSRQSAKVGILNAKELNRQMEKLKANVEKAEHDLLHDFKTRGPDVVAKAVTSVYNVTASQVTGKVRKGTKAENIKATIGGTRISGNSIGNAVIEYRGRRLTYNQFKLNPTRPGKRGYTLKATVYRNEEKTLGNVRKLTKRDRKKMRKGVHTSKSSPIMLFPTGYKKEGGNPYVAMKRRSADRSDIHSVKPTSLPQMVMNDEVQLALEPMLREFINKRQVQHLRNAGLIEKKKSAKK